MERQWWRELEDTHGIRRDDRSSWRQIAGDLKAAKRDPIQARILTGRVRGVFDDLFGPAAWSPPRDWGRPLVTFPGPGMGSFIHRSLRLAVNRGVIPRGRSDAPAQPRQ